MKTSIKITAAMALALLCTSASAQNVTGQIVEASSGDSCPGATIRIFESTDTVQPIALGVTDIDGFFSESLSQPGDYLLRVEYIGKEPSNRQFVYAGGGEVLNLGIIPLYDDAKMLGEVVVSARRPLIQSDGATLTYNAEEDAAAKSSTVLDMLRRVPMVTVDAEDNIKVNGKSDFQIYLNGRPSPLLAANASTVLKAMPASSIVKIEVITEPGAKYDAEGTGGILNIVTQGKQSDDGYSGSITLSMARRGGSGLSLYGNAKRNKVSASLNFNFFTNELWKQSDDQRIEQEFFNSEERHYAIETLSISPSFKYMGGDFNLAWEPDKKNLFTVNFNLNNVPVSASTTDNNEFRDINDNKVAGFTREVDLKIHNFSMSVNGSYLHSFNRQDHNIILSYQYDRSSEKQENNQEFRDPLNYVIEYPFQYNYQHNLNNSHTVQLDYSLPIGDWQKVEAGMKALLRHNPGLSYQEVGFENDKLILNEDNDVEMTQFNDIYAFYGTYSLTRGPWSAGAGVRYEHTHLGANFTKGKYDDFKSNLDDWVPNASVTYSFDMAHNLRAAYQKRIRRPSLQQINPFHDNLLGNSISYGNPDLKSENLNVVSLTYTNFMNRVAGNIKAEYEFTNNLISNYQYADNGIAYSTYRNLGKRRVLNLTTFLTTTIGKVQIGAGGTAMYVNFEMPEMSINRHGWCGSVNGNLNYTMPADIKFSAFGGWGSKGVDIQGKGGAWHYYGVSFKRSFLKNDCLDVTLQAQNFFTPRFEWKGETITPDMIEHTSNKRSAWNLGLSVAFNFGNLKSNVRKTGAVIDNGDASPASNSSGMGSGGNQ